MNEVPSEAAAGEGQSVQPKSVLVVEDSAVYRSMVASCLREWGYDVAVAEDGLKAWEMVQSGTMPNLLIIDWMLPGLDGIELCRRIRGRQTEPYPYVLLLSAEEKKQNLIDGLNAGADDYLTKPFDVDDLRARLRSGMRILSLQGQLLHKEEELRFQALHDPLTGLWNRGAILEFLERELARARRGAEPLAVMVINVDNFKAINDTHGHQAGDVVLQAVARRLAGAMRTYDWVGRYGGQEFLAIVSATDAEGIRGYAERLRACIAEEAIVSPPNFQGKIRLTISIGAAAARLGPDFTCGFLIKSADEALYLAKKNGRNRVEIHGADPSKATPSRAKKASAG
jgi:two-component system, cell cycle response regulator